VDPAAIVARIEVATAMEQDPMADMTTATVVASQATRLGNKRRVFSSPRWTPPCCQIQLSLTVVA
jgi:hypothetical protein